MMSNETITSALKSERSVKECIHIVIVLLLMFGFRFIPPIEPITEVGMQILGIFLGLIYGWNFCEIGWVSLLGIIAYGLSDYTAGFAAALSAAFSNGVFLIVVFVLVFFYIFTASGTLEILTQKFLRIKLFQKNPWFLVAALVYGGWLMTAIAQNGVAVLLLFWGIFYEICAINNIPKGKLTTYIIFGIVFACNLGANAWSFSTTVLPMTGAYTAASGAAVPDMPLNIYLWFTGILYAVFYLLFGKFIMRVDITPLNIDINKLDAQTKLDGYQKLCLTVLIVFFVFALVPSFVTTNFPLVAILRNLGIAGSACLLLVFCAIFKAKGGVGFAEAFNKGILWELALMIAVVMQIAGALTNEATGVSAFLGIWVNALFAGKSILFFLVFATLIPAIITNFANNLATAIIFIPLISSAATSLNVNAPALVACLIGICSACLMTPAGGLFGALLHGNKEWIATADAVRLGFATMILVWIVNCVIGYPVASILFS